jgi:hypothetical protein
MTSIDSIKASDGTDNASVATVQTIRSGGATTIVVDTVLGINTNFHATMGTPHTFTDPVTSEAITVISEATAVDFKGHVSGSDLEIDTIAPGYSDTGSAVGDIVIIKPTTQWADEVAKILEVSLEDNGTLKDSIVTTGKIATGAVGNTDLASSAVSTEKLDATLTALIGLGGVTSKDTSGVNGYIRFKTGVQIAWVQATSAAVSTAFGSLYYGDVNYGNWDAAFTSVVQSWVGGTTSDTIWITGSGGETNTNAGNGRVFRPTSTATVYASTKFAIGTW